MGTQVGSLICHFNSVWCFSYFHDVFALMNVREWQKDVKLRKTRKGHATRAEIIVFAIIMHADLRYPRYRRRGHYVTP